ncbi:hypothetical protein SpCBS45565_g06506 [Spizellomyces sp. 'palustris']|nr:hypothetical protein SpCBS45565_g06506 [Spizellomyces sp. 'palustris']
MRNPTLYLISLIFTLLFWFTNAEHSKTAQGHLDDAKAHMSAGRYNEALDSFDAAITQDPDNYLTYFRRAAVFLTLGRMGTALRDFTKVLQLKPDHHPALLQRTKLHIRQGALQDAIIDLDKYHTVNPGDAEVAQLQADIYHAQTNIKDAETAIKAAECDTAISHLTEALMIVSHTTDLRLKRAECFLKTGDNEMAIADLTRVTKLDPDNTETYVRLSSLHLSLGEIEAALTNVKDCLRRDPDHKSCKRTFREIKKLDKALKSAQDAIANGAWKSVVSKLTSGDAKSSVVGQVEQLGASAKKRVYDMMCKSYAEMKDGKNALTWCSKVLDVNGDDVDALIYRAEAKILMEDYEDAMRDYQKASQTSPHDPRIQSGFTKAQKLHKQSTSKDYYKVLGIPRSATKKEIKKAYRKMAQEWHPDKYSGDLPMDKVEKRMSEINEAYEVLSDDELRKRFDMGDDPNDQGSHGGGSPFQGHPFFQQGGFPFGFQQGGQGSGFQFKFHFT